MKLSSTIYTLADPRSGEIRYVGKAINIESRFNGHLKDKSDSHKARWIRQLKSIGLSPVIEAVETISDVDWQEAERYWIESFRVMGFRLTNLDSGGIGGKRASLETREKLSLSLKGLKRSDENKKNSSIAAIGKKKSDSHIKNMSLALKGRKFTPEWSKKLGDVHRGVPKSEEHRLKISMAQKGVPRAKASEETKAKMRISQTRRHATEKAAKLNDIPAITNLAPGQDQEG